MFTKTAIISLVAGLAAAAPARRADSGTFTLITTRSGTPEVHLRAVHAYQEGLYLGRPTQSYCPSSITGLDCSKIGNTTAFGAGNGGLSMDTMVPGGQQVYVAADGAFGYTIPHSGATPTGALTTGFVYTAPTTEGSVGGLTFNGGSAYACPTGETDPTEGSVYKLYASAVTPAGADRSKCIAASLSASPFTGVAVWEYN